MTMHDAARHEAELVAAFLPAGHSAQVTVRTVDGVTMRTVTMFDTHRRVVSERVFADPLREPNFTTVLAQMPPEAATVITMRLENGSYYWMSEGHGRGQLGD